MIKENILEVRKRVESACLRVKRDPAAVKLIAVSKHRSIEEIREAFLGGITEFGENRVQEAATKYKELSAISCQLSAIRWHMVGHLQTNKVREAVKIFDLIQSVDSLNLAQEINKQACKINKIQDILIEVKTSPEATKFGLMPEDVFDLLKAAKQFKNIAIKGLMTIAPLADNPEEARPYFRILKDLSDQINQAPSTKHQAPILSMGMSDDFEIAIEEGSNLVRIGRALFEGKI